MTIEELKGDLGRLQDDAVQAAHDSRTLIRDFGRQMETVEDEFVAAELLATNNTLEGIGVLFDSAVRLGDIGRQQIRFCIDDSRETIGNLQAAGTGNEYIDAFFGHMGRRMDHMASGVESVGRMVGSELDEFSGSVDASWNLFSKLVNADWSTTANKNN